MSFQAMAWAIKQPVPDPLAKFVLMMLANFADERGESFPSMNRLATDTAMSRSSIIRKLELLETEGYITRRNEQTRTGAWSHNVYTLVASVSQPLGVSERPAPSVPVTHEPIKEPIITPPPREKARRLSTIAEDWTPPPDLLAWAKQAFPRLDIDDEAARFRDHWLGTGKPHLDWNATFRNWCRRSITFSRSPVARGPGADRTGDNARRLSEFVAEYGDPQPRQGPLKLIGTG